MKKAQLLFLFFLALFAFRFFDAHFIDKSFINISSFAYSLVAVLISIPYFLSKRNVFVLPVQMMVVGIILSMLMAYVSWGQDIKDSLIETVPYLMWIFFFFLLHAKISVKTIERIAITYAIVYIALYFFQLASSPTVLFGASLSGDEYTEDRGIIRIIFPGAGLFVLASFIALNKITTEKHKKNAWIVLALLGLIIPVLQVTRIFIAGMLFIYVFHFTQKQTLARRVTILILMVVGTFLVANFNNKVVNGLKSASVTNAKQGQDYVRVEAGTYFLSDFTPNVESYILGNGAPYSSFSKYGRFVDKLGDKRGFFIEDLGLIGMYVMFGILPIIAYIMIWFKSFTLSLPPEYYYAKYYLWYLLISCLTTFNVYHPYFLVSTVFALYIYQSVYERQLTAPSRSNVNDGFPISKAKI